MAPRNEILKSKLLLVEGTDAKLFFIWAFAAYKINDIQVESFGGITELTSYLKTLSMISGYEKVTTLVIARDAETDPVSAISNIKNSLKQASLPIPGNPFEFSGDNFRTAFMIFPGFDGLTVQSGTLEDLCLDIVKDCSTFDCVDAYIQCLQANGHEIKRLHKTRLHTYLSGKNDFVGLKIGEAAKAGAWDWEHLKLKPFRDVITAM